MRAQGREPPASGRISQPTLFLEVDGLWVHLQSPEHRDEALPRFLYEQARKAASFELKLTALYAGKKEVVRPRVVRVGLGAAAPGVHLGDEVQRALPRRVVLECGHPQRRWRPDSRRTGEASGRLFPQNLTRTLFEQFLKNHHRRDI